MGYITTNNWRQKVENLKKKFIDKAKQGVYTGVLRVLSSKMAFILCSDHSFIFHLWCGLYLANSSRLNFRKYTPMVKHTCIPKDQSVKYALSMLLGCKAYFDCPETVWKGRIRNAACFIQLVMKSLFGYLSGNSSNEC